MISLPDDFISGYDNVTVCATIENQLRADELDETIDCIVVGGESGSNVR